MGILNTAIVPSLAYAFPVVPCDPDLLEGWDVEIGKVVKHKFSLMNCTPTAMVRENKEDFGLGCQSIAAEYHRRNAEALIHSLNHKTERHRNVTEAMLKFRMEGLREQAFQILTEYKARSTPLRRALQFNMRARQMLSIKLSNTSILKQGSSHFCRDLEMVLKIVSTKSIAYDLRTLAYVIARPLVALGASSPADLMTADKKYVASGATLHSCCGAACCKEHVVALNRLADLLHLSTSAAITHEIVQDIFRSQDKSKSKPAHEREIHRRAGTIKELEDAFTKAHTNLKATETELTPATTSDLPSQTP